MYGCDRCDGCLHPLLCCSNKYETALPTSVHSVCSVRSVLFKRLTPQSYDKDKKNTCYVVGTRSRYDLCYIADYQPNNFFSLSWNSKQKAKMLFKIQENTLFLQRKLIFV